MSQENAETVRLAYDHLNRGDVERLARLCGEDFVMDMSGRVFNPDVYTGPDGIRRFLQDVSEVWESYHWNLEDTLVRDDNLVVAMLHCEAQGREGGPEVDWHVAWVWKFERGTPVSLRFYRDPSQALEAVGLSE